MTLHGFIDSVEAVHRINAVATKAKFPLYIECGNITSDAKSFVNLFPLIGKEVTVVAGDNADPKLFKRYVKQMGI